MTIWIERATNGQFYFSIRSAGNYRKLATSETYHNKSDCRSAAELIKRDAGQAMIVDQT